jgi:glutamate synthase domain-containing protein 2/glutamate synthase domain-containing protein 3
MPVFTQVFVTARAGTGNDRDGAVRNDDLERRLYVIRKRIERRAYIEYGWSMDDFYIPSFSCYTIVYKGMFVAPQFARFYPDLSDPRMKSALALVHQRYSTNTFPSWPLAQPFRTCAHNGEINTLRRNVNAMHAREKSMHSEVFGVDMDELYPVVYEGVSDSAAFDNVFELLVRAGRSPAHSAMMMIPEAFGARYHISTDKRSFYEYHAAIMEPWDGPAAIAFTDGTIIGATLDRNGLRPGRYVISDDGLMVMASEAGVLDIPSAHVLEKGRLAPGRMIIADTRQKRILRDNEIKSYVSRRRPYRTWLDKNRIQLRGLHAREAGRDLSTGRLTALQHTFGYTEEDCSDIIQPMVENAQEPIGSMGNDTPPAVLSARPRLLFDYFKQMFAQVTNPPIDPYRENLVMSLMSFIGREANLLEETANHCRQLKLPHPILTNADLENIRQSDVAEVTAADVSICFPARTGELEPALRAVCAHAEECIDNGATHLILSDRAVDDDHAPIPSLLAVSAVYHHLVRRGKNHLADCIVDSGEPREVHHFAALIAYGAGAVTPYGAFATIADMVHHGRIHAADRDSLTLQEAIERYITAIKKGLLKVMSKMGISTIRSYRGSQIFEIVGLHEDVVDTYFAGSTSRIGGARMTQIEHDVLVRHRRFRLQHSYAPAHRYLDSGGMYAFRQEGEKRLFSPTAIVTMQKAVRTNDYALFKQYCDEIHAVGKSLSTFRGLFTIRKGDPIPLEQVEPVDSIVKRFVSSAMSFGSMSKEAHETMAVAMNRLGANSNCGEGGEDEARFVTRDNGDSALSNVKQVASGRFGVTSNYCAHCRELQIKMAQGAKPGEGGQLPGHKVNDIIAKVRNATPGVMLISPPPHHDIYSIEDLAQLIYDLKNANRDARVSVKLVSETGVGTVAAGVAKGKADMVLISGCDGGTGASPLSSIMHAGSYWELGLAETQQTLVRNNLRSGIRLQVDGQMKTGRDVVIGALLGAEEFGFGTATLVAMGCVLMRKCHQNTCPVGIATQDPRLRARFNGQVEHVMCFMRFVARHVREYMADMGFARFDDMVGRIDMLDIDRALRVYDEKGLDLRKLLTPPEVPENGALRCITPRTHDFSDTIDSTLLEQCRSALIDAVPVRTRMPIRNCHRAVGAALSCEISKRYGSRGLPKDTITCTFDGSAGQSFGAFLAPGVTFRLYGDANDYLGKGLSGGTIVVRPPDDATYLAEKNSIVGNVTLFGATGGTVYICGQAGERFAVRNSGATAVVEGIGDHGCEYMTGGRVIVLGQTGVNFAAGMSGGIAYVLDDTQLFDTRCNLGMVNIETLIEKEDLAFLETQITRHTEYTQSRLGRYILDNWRFISPLFVKVMPTDYKIALRKLKEKENETSETAEMTEEVYA